MVWVRGFGPRHSATDMQSHKTLTPRQALNVLRRRRVLILSVTLFVAVVVFGLSHLPAKKYQSTASVLFNPTQIGEQLAGITSSATSDTTQALQDTNVALMQRAEVAQTAATVLGGGFTRNRVKSAVSVYAVGDTNIVNATATAASPALAARIANAYVDSFVSIEATSNRELYSSALSVVTRQLAQIPASQQAGATAVELRTRAASLSLLASLSAAGVQVSQPAIAPDGASSPQPLRYAAIAAVIALLLTIIVAYALEAFATTMQSSQDFEAAYGLPLLGEIPTASDFSARANASVPASLAEVRPEAFDQVRTHLRYFNVDARVSAILVTSAVPSDGKSTIARHLAAAAARSGSKVLLIDADMRRPTSAGRLGVKPEPGLADILIGESDFESAVQQVSVKSARDEAHPRAAFDVLVAGMPALNAAQLAESKAMRDVVERARADYELVIIDTPPLAAAADAVPLFSLVDGVVVVARVGHDRRDAVSRAADIITRSGAPALGIIANAIPRSGSDSYYYGTYAGQA